RRGAPQGREGTPPPPASGTWERRSGRERRRTSESSPASVRSRPLDEGASAGNAKSPVRPLGLSTRPGRWTPPHPSVQNGPPMFTAVLALALAPRPPPGPPPPPSGSSPPTPSAPTSASSPPTCSRAAAPAPPPLRPPTP